MFYVNKTIEVVRSSHLFIFRHNCQCSTSWKINRHIKWRNIVPCCYSCHILHVLLLFIKSIIYKHNECYIYDFITYSEIYKYFFHVWLWYRSPNISFVVKTKIKLVFMLINFVKCYIFFSKILRSYVKPLVNTCLSLHITK